MDVGTSFGGIGSSREMMIASLAEPAMIMIVFTLALIAGSTQLSTIAGVHALARRRPARLARPALVALIMVAIAENARIPVDNPATHLELTMVHEAMVLEYSGRHLALIELAACAEAAALCLADRLPLRALGPRPRRTPAPRDCSSAQRAYLGKLAVGGVAARGVRDLDRQDARLPRAGIPRRRPDAGLLGDAAALRVAELLMHGLDFDVAHLLAGGLVLVSFMLLYQDRLYALLNVFALHAVVLALSVAWQAYHPGRAASLRHRR